MRHGTQDRNQVQTRSLSLKRQIEAGEAFDLVIIGSDVVDDLIKQGKIAGDTRMDIVRVGIGVAVREGAPKPDISSVDAFKSTLLSAKSLTYAPEGATGSICQGARSPWDHRAGKGQDQAKCPRARSAGRRCGRSRTRNRSYPFILSAKGVQLVGPLPAELQNWFVNTAGVSATAKQPDAAKALIKHLTTPEAAAVIKAKGMEPPGR